MNKSNIAFTAAIMLSLAGCISTASVERRLEPMWVGKNFDNFVMRYGPPASKYELSSGDILFTWNPGTKSTTMPITATTNGNGLTQVSGGGSFSEACEIQILADKSGTIKQLKIMKDSWGTWTTSRCHELLKHYDNK